MREDVFYNAIHIALESNYKKILDLIEKYGSWEVSWNSLSAAEKGALTPEAEWKRLQKLDIRLILRDDEKFPALLKEIPWPPCGIYVRGTLPYKELSLAVVGTRKATAEGKSTAKKFSSELAKKNCVIISGLAFGIDAAAHVGCLDAKGITIAVLANGLDSIYPKTHHALAKKIIETGGSLVSEYPLCAPAFPARFLERNRIISGLSRGTLVIEAPERSGSLATARFAMDQNRDVFVVPGPISHPNFRGSNRLIRNGAQLVTQPEDILEAFGVALETKINIEELESEEERLVCSALRKFSRPADVDAIMEATNLTITDANTALSFLVIKNIVKETEGGYTLGN